MTPKEKAIELVSRFLTYSNQFYDNDIIDAKECALIAVEEILPIIQSYEDALSASQKSDELEYWQEVKQEIEKL